MIKALLLFTTLFTTSAWACPNLAGSYTCDQGGDPYPLEVTQREDAGVTFYSINGSEVAADGREYAIDEDESVKDGRYNVICDGDAIVVDMSATLYDPDNGNLDGKYWGQDRISASSTSLVDKFTGTFTRADGSEENLAQDIVCGRN